MNKLRSCLLALCLLAATGSLWPASGQMAVQNVVPANGAVNVDTAATFSITFSQPLDTSRHFLYPEGFFINLILLPETLMGNRDSISLSADLKTVYVHNLHLHPDTQYWLLITNAYSTAGDSLNVPYCASFSTGPALPSGMVDGRVLNASSSDVIGTVVLLFQSYPFSGEEGMTIPGTVITDAVGNFSIPYVPAGTYWVVALKNFYLSYRGEIEFKSSPALGFPDFDFDHVIDSIQTVSGGYLNLNPFFMEDVTKQTVQNGEQLVQPVAQGWQNDAVLTAAMGQPEPDGESFFWFYNYYSPGSLLHRQWVAMGNKVWWANIGSDPDDIYPLPTGWLDSDSILAIAEAEGGMAFRQMYPNAEIFAGIGAFSTTDEIENVLGLTKPTPPKRHSIGIGDRSIFALWQIEYYVPNDTAHWEIALDAVTGENLTKPCTASPAYQSVEPMAVQWMSDARLYQIFTLSELDTSGKSAIWKMDFYSPMQHMIHSFYMMGRLPISDWDEGPPADTLTVPSGWMDSDQALWIAESAGGAAFRQQHPGCIITTQLSRWHNSPNPEKTVWIFFYQAPNAPTETYIVDAFNGQVVSLQQTGSGEIPDSFVLSAPYPNPFNPVTRIPFAISAAGKVDLRIYNVLGQLVEHPLSLPLTAGSHEIEWKPAADLPAGIYWIRLSWKNQHKLCKVVLLK